MWLIYALIDPRVGAVRYVGKTVNAEKRLAAHLRDRTDTRRGRWIRLLLREGWKPILLVLEQGSGVWQTAEQQWIAKYRADGADLTNATDGGEGLSGATAETRLKIGMAQRARWTGEARARSLALVQTPEHRAAVSLGLIGKPKSPAHVAKLPQNQQDFDWSDEVRAARRANLISYAHPAAAAAPRTEIQLAHLKAMSEANRGKPGWAKGRVLSAEEREVRSVKQRGRPKTAEHKEKIRLAALRRWAREREGNEDA